IFVSDPNVIFGKPDINTDPDTIGWFYFLFALNPGIWEELGFRGIILSDLREKYADHNAIILSSFLFGLMHFSNMVFLSFEEALGGVIMATLFGLFWGYLTVKTGSVLPAMISHYLIDAFGAYLINVDQSNEEVMGQYFLFLILLYPLFGYILTRRFVSHISPLKNSSIDLV
ncbi:MAG: CPBP family intramembrane glutamic endopeptidase, partial [Candidatus Kariarchaeaceae archaeon]